MLRLDLDRKPRWLDMPHGVRLLVRPLTSGVILEARRDPILRSLAPDGDEDGAAEPDQQQAALAFAKALARAAVLEWEGVGNQAGEPLDVTPELVEALLDDWTIYDAFQAGYVQPGLRIDAEGNG